MLKTKPSTLNATTITGIGVVALLIALAIYRGANSSPDPKTKLITSLETLSNQCTQVSKGLAGLNPDLKAIGEIIQPFATGESTEAFTRQSELLHAVDELAGQSEKVVDEVNKMEQMYREFSGALDNFIAKTTVPPASKEQIMTKKSSLEKNVQSVVQDFTAMRSRIALLRLLASSLNKSKAQELYIAVGTMQTEVKNLERLASVAAPSGLIN